MTDDFEWEDPVEKFVGKEEFGHLLYFCKYVQDIEYNVFGEHHSTHEMILDWSLKVCRSLCYKARFILRSWIPKVPTFSLTRHAHLKHVIILDWSLKVCRSLCYKPRFILRSWVPKEPTCSLTRHAHLKHVIILDWSIKVCRSLC